MASLAADSAMETISNTQERAKEFAAASAASLQSVGSEGLSTMANGLTSGVSRVRMTASESVASIDLSKLEAGSLANACSLFAQSARENVSNSFSNAESSTAGGSCNRPNPKASDEDSESGGEDGGKAVSFLSRLGLQDPRRPESQLLLGNAKGEVNGISGASPAGVASTFSVRSSFTTLPSSFSPLSNGSFGNIFSTSAPKEAQTPLEKIKSCACLPALTYQQRLTGFVICFAFGTILSMSALSSLGSLLLGNAAPFAFKYTAGNLLSIGSSSFLVGPTKQCRDMAAPERATASLVYVITLIGTLWSVFFLRIQIISFAFIICQFCALTWYMLSYVPYGQTCVKRMIKRIM